MDVSGVYKPININKQFTGGGPPTLYLSGIRWPLYGDIW